MSSRRRKSVLKRPDAVAVGCSWRRRTYLTPFFSPLPKAKAQNSHSTIASPSSSTTIWETCSHTSSSSSAAAPAAVNSSSSSTPSRLAHHTPSLSPPESLDVTDACTASTTAPAVEMKTERGVEGSVAVVKESSDPYADFLDSMLQMVLEMEICAWEDICDLLRRFLSLNAPRHHHIIIHAFAEVYRIIFSPSDCSSADAEGVDATTTSSAVTVLARVQQENVRVADHGDRVT